MMLRIFSYAYLPPIYLLWCNACSNRLPISFLGWGQGGLSSYCWVLKILWIFCIHKSFIGCVLQNFHPVCGLSFYSNSVLHKTEVFYFNKILFLFFHGSCFGCCIKKTHSQTQSLANFSLMSSSRSFKVLYFIFRTMIHLKFNFV